MNTLPSSLNQNKVFNKYTENKYIPLKKSGSAPITRCISVYTMKVFTVKTFTIRYYLLNCL